MAINHIKYRNLDTIQIKANFNTESETDIKKFLLTDDIVRYLLLENLIFNSTVYRIEVTSRSVQDPVIFDFFFQAITYKNQSKSDNITKRIHWLQIKLDSEKTIGIRRLYQEEIAFLRTLLN